MNQYYKLDENKNAISCSQEDWAHQKQGMYGSEFKHVAKETVNDMWISTVWLGLNHAYPGDEKPKIFETMILNEKKREWLDYEEHYSTWQEALDGHRRAVQWVKEGCNE